MTTTQVQSTSSPSPTPTQAVNSNSGLSTRAKAGIGVGVGVGTPFLIGLGFATFWYGKRSNRSHPATEENGEGKGHVRFELEAIESQRRPHHDVVEWYGAERLVEVGSPHQDRQQ